MASTKEAVPEEAASASDEVEETLPEDVVDSPDFPFVDGLTDLTLRIQNTRLHVSKSILMIASPVFRKMLTSESKEKLQNDFVLENKGETVITLLMKCLYPDQNITYSGKYKSHTNGKNQGVFVKYYMYAPGSNKVKNSILSFKVKVKVTRSLTLGVI